MLRASRTADDELRVQAEAASSPVGDGEANEPKAAWELELERQKAAEQASRAAAADLAVQAMPEMADDLVDPVTPADAAPADEAAPATEPA
jgi:hypothetical protein